MRRVVTAALALAAGLAHAQDRPDVRRAMAAEALQLARAIEKQRAWDDVRFIAGFAGTAEARAYLDAVPPRPSRTECPAAVREFGRRWAPRYRELARRAGTDDALRFDCVAEILTDIEQHHEAFRHINAIRRRNELPPVEFDLALAVGVTLHARYLTFNPDDKHDEHQQKQGYTGEGAVAGRRSVLAFGCDLKVSVDQWMGTFYHRIPFLNPALRRVGTGQKGKGGDRKTGCDVFSACDRVTGTRALPYPPPGATGVPLSFEGEWPNPIPDDPDGRGGCPVTLSFFGGEPKNARARLLDGGRGEIDCWFSTPDRPARQDFPNLATLCLIPKAPLRSGRTYQAVVEYELDGRSARLEWSFSTKR